MEQIRTMDQLIYEAMKISAKDKRIEFVMNYFLNTVNYDYACLFAAGYTQGTISQVESGFRLKKSKFEKDGISEVVLSRKVIEGESVIFNEILKLQEESNGNYDLFINSLKQFVENELKKHIRNEEILGKCISRFINKLEDDLLNKKMDVTKDGKKYTLNYDVSSILIDYILDRNTNFPPEIQDGLIKNGVCEHYSDYLIPVMKKIGVEAHQISGTSELGHSWIIVKGENDYKSIDLTRAIFIRDGFLGIPKEQTSQDWLYTDIDRMFEMQSTRTIKKVDDVELPEVITLQNYNKEEFERVINADRDKKSKVAEGNSLKYKIEEGLREGIGETETRIAEQKEIPKESEVSQSEQ